MGGWNSDFELLNGNWGLQYEISGKLGNMQLEISICNITPVLLRREGSCTEEFSVYLRRQQQNYGKRLGKVASKQFARDHSPVMPSLL